MASIPTFAFKAPLYRFLFVLLMAPLFSHATQSSESLTCSLVRFLGSISDNSSSSFRISEFSSPIFVDCSPIVFVRSAICWSDSLYFSSRTKTAA
jgi:hypothetical protein